MRIERLVVRVMYPRLVAILAEESQLMLVAEVDDFLVVAVADEDGHAFSRMVRREIDGALHGVEVTATVRADHQAILIGIGPLRFRTEAPAAAAGDAVEAAVGQRQYFRIDLH